MSGKHLPQGLAPLDRLPRCEELAPIMNRDFRCVLLADHSGDWHFADEFEWRHKRADEAA